MQDVSGRAVATLSHADDMMAMMQTTLSRIDKGNLGEKAASILADLNLSVTKLNKVLDAFSGQKGLLASAQRATDALGDVGRSGRVTQRELDATLRSVSEAAESIRSFIDAIERDPDMLIKGKSRGDDPK